MSDIENQSRTTRRNVLMGVGVGATGLYGGFLLNKPNHNRGLCYAVNLQQAYIVGSQPELTAEVKVTTEETVRIWFEYRPRSRGGGMYSTNKQELTGPSQTRITQRVRLTPQTEYTHRAVLSVPTENGRELVYSRERPFTTGRNIEGSIKYNNCNTVTVLGSFEEVRARIVTYAEHKEEGKYRLLPYHHRTGPVDRETVIKPPDGLPIDREDWEDVPGQVIFSVDAFTNAEESKTGGGEQSGDLHRINPDYDTCIDEIQPSDFTTTTPKEGTQTYDTDTPTRTTATSGPFDPRAEFDGCSHVTVSNDRYTVVELTFTDRSTEVFRGEWTDSNTFTGFGENAGKDIMEVRVSNGEANAWFGNPNDCAKSDVTPDTTADTVTSATKTRDTPTTMTTTTPTEEPTTTTTTTTDTPTTITTEEEEDSEGEETTVGNGLIGWFLRI